MAGESADSAPLKGRGPVLRNGVLPKVIHVVDKLEPGSAQHIHTALTRGNPEALGRKWLSAGMDETDA